MSIIQFLHKLYKLYVNDNESSQIGIIETFFK